MPKQNAGGRRDNPNINTDDTRLNSDWQQFIRQRLFNSMTKILSSESTTITPKQRDGRRSRTVETRKRIVRAVAELVQAGKVAPTAEEVSARASVGLRTVFRHFDDMDSLYQEIDQELGINVALMLQMVMKADTWQERLKENIQMRCQLYDSITPFLISGQVHRHTSQAVEASFRRKVELERAVLQHILPKSLQEDTPRFEALLMMLSPEAWIRLRRDQGLSSEAAIAAIHVCIHAVIAP
jgi:AcrR family transcriptional regulator